MPVEDQYAQSEITIVAGGESQLMACTDALCGAVEDHMERVEARAREQPSANSENRPPTASLWSESVNFMAGNFKAHFEQQRKARAIPRPRQLQEILADYNHSGMNSDGSMVVQRM